MRDLSEEGRRIIEALIKAPVAWQSPGELARSIGRDLEETTDLVANLDVSGWLTAWERDVDVVVTLSVAGAAFLGLRLVESGRDQVPRWANQGDPEPPGLRASRVFRDERAAAFDRLLDPALSVEEALERAEEAMIRHPISADPRVRPTIDHLPGPTLLIGLGLIPWPGPGDGRKASCPSCASKRLGPSMYCLYCDRWGLDHRIPDESLHSSRRLRDSIEEIRRQEWERQARKTRRKARRQAQAEAERAARRRRKRA